LLIKALASVDRHKQNVNEKKQLLAFQTLRQQNANISFNAAQQVFNQASHAASKSEHDLLGFFKSLDVAKKNFELASIEGNSASKTYNDSRSDFEVT
jgi:hypothetical protein